MGKRLSKRLLTVASFVPNGAFLADVGSDHAWLPITLAQEGKIAFAMAIDNKMGPFLRMKDNINKSGVATRVIASRSDGISELRDEIDTVAICGVGGILACQILEAHPEKLSSVQAIIIDPHRDLATVRKRVSDLGFHIADEEMVFEDKIYYSIIKFVPGSPQSPYSGSDLAFGPVLRKKRTLVFLKWLEVQKSKVSALLNSPLSDAARQRYLAMYRAIAKELEGN